MDAKNFEMIFVDLITTHSYTMIKEWYDSDLRLSSLNFFETAKELEYYLHFLSKTEIKTLTEDKFISHSKELAPNGFKALTFLRNFNDSNMMN